MRPGGGKEKGASFEREVCSLLSRWITDGQHSDIFERNVQSGGRFTQAMTHGRAVRGVPGDIMAAHEQGIEFMSVFMVECKHYKSIGLEDFLFDFAGKQLLSQIIALAFKQAAEAKLRPLIIAKQNRKPTLVFTDERTFEHIDMSTRLAIPLKHHSLHRPNGNKVIMAFRLADMLSQVRIAQLLARIKADATQR